jgi:hypothetical protein
VVVYTVSGPGSIDPNGRYTATTAGTATVTACGRKNRLCSTATVTINPPAPPPPPPSARTLTRCEISPSSSQPRIDQPVSYTVTAYYSDGTSSVVSNPTLSSGGTVNGNRSLGTPGGKTITANCGTGAGGSPVNGSASARTAVRRGP